MNGLMLQDELKARGNHEVRVMTAIPIPSVAEPFIRLREHHPIPIGIPTGNRKYRAVSDQPVAR